MDLTLDVTDLWEYLSKTDKLVVIYGTGNGADKIINQLEKRKIKISAIFASDGFVRDRYFRGFHVQSFDDVIRAFGDVIVLVSFGSSLANVIDNIKKISSICETYAPDVPVIDDGNVFDKNYFADNFEKIKKALSLLSDDESRNVFINIVRYKITGKIDYLLNCESDKSEAIKLLNLSDTESYLDLGAYNGDTVEEFINSVNGYKDITAVEPDMRNFKKLAHNTNGLHNICNYNVGISDKDGEMLFSMRGGRNSSVNGKGDIIKCRCINSLCYQSGVSYIKMDVEGQERAAILGGANTIKKYAPKMNIAVYHRNEDIFDLPILVNSINPNYKLYLRHHPYIPAWDTNLYCI